MHKCHLPEQRDLVATAHGMMYERGVEVNILVR